MEQKSVQGTAALRTANTADPQMEGILIDSGACLTKSVDNNGGCRPLIFHIDVQLDCDYKTMVQPDVLILYHNEKIKKRMIFGAPDFVLEVISPSTRKKDCTKKLSKYIEAGVREYWILDPDQKRVLVYFFESDVYPVIYGMESPISVNIYEGKLSIQFDHISKWIDEEEE